MKRHLEDFGIGKILTISFAIILVLYAISIGVGVFAVHQNAEATQAFYNRPYHVSTSASELSRSIQEINSCLGEIVEHPESSEIRAEKLTSIEEQSNIRASSFAMISNYFSADEDLLTRFSDANWDLVTIRDQVLSAISAGDFTHAADLYENSYIPQKDKTTALANDISSKAEFVARDFVDQAKKLELLTFAVIGVVALLVVVIIFIIRARITRAIAVPVRAIEENTKRVAQGDLSTMVDYASENELGELAKAMNKTIASLRTTVRRIDQEASQVSRTSSQMSDGAQIIAQGSAEQAMAIEELATSVQNIERVVEENNESVLLANNSASEVLVAVENGSDQTTKTAEVVDRIKANAQSISQLASTIDDISLQTSILALNASVEAARAGDSGRGFSIVAEEIRRLAMQVSEASHTANELTRDTITGVEEGSTIIGGTAESMKQAVTATGSINSMMATIAQASRQQLKAVMQIRESLDSLSDVVQENSAAAEESATIGEELAERSNELKRLIGDFRYEEDACNEEISTL